MRNEAPCGSPERLRPLGGARLAGWCLRLEGRDRRVHLVARSGTVLGESIDAPPAAALHRSRLALSRAEQPLSLHPVEGDVDRLGGGSSAGSLLEKPLDLEAVRTVGLEERHGREDAVLQRAEQARVLAHGVTSKTKHRIGKTVSFSPSMPPPTQAARLFR